MLPTPYLLYASLFADILDEFVTPPKKRCRTDEEKRKRDVEKHKLRPPCTCTKLNCRDKISQETWINTYSAFWQLTKQQRDIQMFSLLDVTEPKTLKRDASSNRDRTVTYHIKDPSGARQRVCKTFFLSTHGYLINTSSIINDLHQILTNKSHLMGLASLIPSISKMGESIHWIVWLCLPFRMLTTNKIVMQNITTSIVGFCQITLTWSQ